MVTWIVCPLTLSVVLCRCMFLRKSATGDVWPIFPQQLHLKRVPWFVPVWISLLSLSLYISLSSTLLSHSSLLIHPFPQCTNFTGCLKYWALTLNFFFKLSFLSHAVGLWKRLVPSVSIPLHHSCFRFFSSLPFFILIVFRVFIVLKEALRDILSLDFFSPCTCLVAVE